MYQKMFVGIKNTKDLVHGKELTEGLERGAKKSKGLHQNTVWAMTEPGMDFMGTDRVGQQVRPGLKRGTWR